MQKLSKAILIALAVLLALVVAAMLGVNLYLQSPGVQARIQDELSRALRMPLTITNTSFTPWSDLRITGISIPNGGTNLLEATSFNARYRFWPLLDRKLVIHRMSVDSPKVIWAQNEAGKWELPKPEKKPVAPQESTATAAAPAPEPALKDEKPKEKKTATAEAAKEEKRKLEVVIEGFQIKHGHIELLDRAQQPVATLMDVNLDFTTLTEERVAGTAEIGRAIWANVVVLEEVRTPFAYTNGVIDLPEFAARVGNGPVKGRFHWDPTTPQSLFRTTLDFEYVELAKVGADAGWAPDQASGTLRGNLELAGSSKEILRAEGRAKLTLRNGRFHDFLYFEMIGHALQIKELSDLRLNESHAELRIADEKAFIESLTLDAANLQLGGTGLVRFDGKLQIAARLTARERLVKELPGLVRDNFTAGEDGSRYLDFNITGKTNKPKTDLLDKIVGQKIEAQLDDLLSSLFPSKQKKEDEEKKKEAEKKKKKKKDEESKEAPAAAPAESPAPAEPASPQ